ncbi:MAG: hypothetical protein ACRDOV_10275 [Streptomyces sp.]
MVPVSPSDSTRPKRRARILRIAAASVVLLAIAGYVAAQYVTSRPGPAQCTVRAAGSGSEGGYAIKPEQAANAATIAAVASQRELPERAVTIALATAMQESTLRNIAHGDRDSLGLFQQRPSQGWGSEEQISDPVYSSGKFYDHLVRIPGYSRLPLTVAAQRVQRSGFPQAYAKHEANASLLTAALTGRRAAAFTCTTGPGGPDGTTGSAERVRERLVREFGDDVLSAQGRPTSTAARGVSLRESDADSELRVPARAGRHGWELAHWAMANSAELHIARISYRNRVWDAASSEEGWRTREGGSGGSPGTGDASVTVRLATGQ